MKVIKAMKEKNRLAGEIGQLQKRLLEQNVRPEGQEFDYDNHELYRQLRDAIDELVQIKTAIARANAPIYPAIFRLAELKGLLNILNDLETKSGKFREALGYGVEAREVEYRAQIGQRELDALTRSIEAEMVALQDELDEFNAAHSLEPA